MSKMGIDVGLTEMRRLRQEVEDLHLPESLGDFVRECAASMGDKTLGNWFEEGETLSYSELDEKASRLASSLTALGVRKGSHVAVMLPNIPAFPITWVALGRVGAVMIPVNSSYTWEELHFVVTDSDSQFLIIDADLLPVYEKMERPAPLLAQGKIIVHGNTPKGEAPSWQDLLDNGDAGFAPPTPVKRSDLLNIQYTSGTTGFPKGCMLTHDYWLIIGHYAAYFRSDQRDLKNILIWAPFFYMDPMWQFLMTMKLGATAYVARKISLTRFYDWLGDLKIDYCIFPEPALKARLSSERDRELSLKYVSIYGWRREARAEVQSRFNVVAREGYGMTEIGGATIVPAAATQKALEPTCGLPAPFRELKIVDDKGNDVPDGESGELWVAGRSILWGYYKRPAANADSFRGKWFRTGDIFRRDADGYYYIIGRIKDMIKRAGENIAAQEVEAAIEAMDEVEESAVVPEPDALRREEIKAYVLLREDLRKDGIAPERIIEHCSTRLAPFKVPRYIAFVSDFPRTPSRKVKKNVLIAESQRYSSAFWDRSDHSWHED